MTARVVFTRSFGTGTGCLLTCLVCVVAICLSAGCSKKQKTIATIKEEYSKKNYAETMVQCEHALRNNIAGAEVYYYYGLALLAVGRDFESFDRFSKGVALDSTFAEPVANQLIDAARTSFRAGRESEAGKRLKLAADLKPDREFGIFAYALGDAYFSDKGYANAVRFYEAAITERPDTSAAESAYANLAASYLAVGDSIGAVDALERQLAGFPTGPAAAQAEWKLDNLLYERARSEFGRGNYEATSDIVIDLLKRTDNTSLKQRARFVLGESYER
ncbi:MAG: hypothetical protein JSW50_04825, partial [Candidatus Latescibacterota bacterium]